MSLSVRECCSFERNIGNTLLTFWNANRSSKEKPHSRTQVAVKKIYYMYSVGKMLTSYKKKEW